MARSSMGISSRLGLLGGVSGGDESIMGQTNPERGV